MIPRDLSLIYFGGTWREHGLAERISCVAVDEHGIGARAAELLHEMRSGKRAIDNDERIVFPVTVWPGETVAEAPGGVVEAAISSGRSEQMAGSAQ
jgi:DNA-binding LacI/PurR family transcriptional regulator